VPPAAAAGSPRIRGPCNARLRENAPHSKESSQRAPTPRASDLRRRVGPTDPRSHPKHAHRRTAIGSGTHNGWRARPTRPGWSTAATPRGARPRRGSRLRLRPALALLALVLAAASPAPAAGPSREEEGPLDGFNRVMGEFNWWVLQHVLEPAARGYNWIVPKPAQHVLGNAIANLQRPRDFANSVLQGKGTRAGTHMTSFVLNTTLGLGGLFYVSDHFLPDDSPETFNETLGVWGLPTGPYLVLPVLGGTSPRGLVGTGADTVMNPLFWIPGAAGTLAGASSRTVGGLNTLATLMPVAWASESEWQAFEQVFSERTAYPVEKQLYFENQILDVED
jgi:phospholipid-binding lipoprotein MlaA